MTASARRANAFLCLAGTALIAACSQSPTGDAPATPPAPGTTAGATTTSATSDVPQGRFIRAVPASLPDCNPAVVMLEWDTNTLTPPPPSVRIHIASAESERLFAAGGAKGSAETGRWALPGSTFLLRNGETGEELERVVIGGPACSR